MNDLSIHAVIPSGPADEWGFICLRSALISFPLPAFPYAPSAVHFGNNIMEKQEMKMKWKLAMEIGN